ncbi:MAG TPA: T9SS type A sorting domain-containing protein [Bacteroidia bacterium]|nr:T9SS type A sorting domain-containing protein [Bacteroidia bacterium]
MKKIILSLLAVSLLASLSEGQNLKIINPVNSSVVNGMTLNYWGDPSHQMEIYLNVQNISSGDITVKCKRDTISTVSGSSNLFCWVQCYGPGTDQSPTGQLIKADSVYTLFRGYYNPNGVGVTTIRYVYFDQSNPNDSSWVIVNYNVTPTGVQNLGNVGQNSLSSAYPNPASDIAALNYSLASNTTSAKIDFYNMLGQKVNELPIDVINRSGTVKIDVSGMNTGIYFYTFVVNDKTIATKKLIVTH